MTDQNQYLGNPNLKRANVPVEFTKEQIGKRPFTNINLVNI